jgi:hypothetical protein
MNRFSNAASVASLFACAVASAQSFNCTVNSQASTLSQTTTITAPFAGNLIGNYDATTNPTGTQTRPGVFGGSGNQPIPYTASFVLDGDLNSNPLGSFVADVDAEVLQVSISGFSLDLLGASIGTLPATININYQTFRTFSPNSLFPGGVTIPVPIGDATISELQAFQNTEAVTGVLTPVKGGGYSFVAAVPVDLVLSAEVMGAPVAQKSIIPGVVPITGTVQFTPAGVSFSFSISSSDSQTQPVTDGAFTNQPLALPTVLPTGGTANLLISGTVTSVSTATALTATVVGTGVAQAVPGDLDGDGAVGGKDLTILLSNWGASGEGDINGDGTVGGADLAILLSNWG